MLATIDLTFRQARRVLEQALRYQVRLEIEPRAFNQALTGTLVKREDDLLTVELLSPPSDAPLAGLVGSFCDIKMIIAEELYLFSSCVVDVVGEGGQHRLRLAPPDVVQVANRRKFDRLVPTEQVVVQVWAPGRPTPMVGMLNNVTAAGISVRVPRADVDDALLIDDEVRVSFQLPGTPDVFTLAALVCVKQPVPPGEHTDVGFEFRDPQPDAVGGNAMTRLQGLVARGYQGGQS